MRRLVTVLLKSFRFLCRRIVRRFVFYVRVFHSRRPSFVLTETRHNVISVSVARQALWCPAFLAHTTVDGKTWTALNLMAIVWGLCRVPVCARGVPHATGAVDTSTRACSFSSARLAFGPPTFESGAFAHRTDLSAFYRSHLHERLSYVTLSKFSHTTTADVGSARTSCRSLYPFFTLFSHNIVHKFITPNTTYSTYLYYCRVRTKLYN